MVLVQPRQIESLGFRLSVVASLALVLVLTGLTAKDRTSRLGVVLTATVAAQLATLPVLLPAFGTVSLTERAGKHRRRAVGGDRDASRGPRRYCRVVLAAARGGHRRAGGPCRHRLIRSIDVLAAPDAYVSVGVPPLPAAAAIAVTVSILLLLIGGNEFRGIFRSWTQRGPVTRAPAAVRPRLARRASQSTEPDWRAVTDYR